MLSRIADSLFWLNRYMERADGMLRVIRTNYILSFDKSPKDSVSWKPVLNMFTALTDDEITEIGNEVHTSLNLLILDTKNINSLKVIINRARENARGIQDNITKEVWEQVNQSYHLFKNASFTEKLGTNHSLEVLDNLTDMFQLYNGVTDSTMPRGIGWSFMNLGKYVERCLITLEIADRHFRAIHYNLDEVKNILFWKNLLFSLSGYELYLKTYRSTDYCWNVAHQVLFNHDFPRSVHYSLVRIEKYLEDVIGENEPEEKDLLKRSFGRLFSKVQFADPASINRLALQQFLATVRTELLQFAKLLGQSFFSYV